MGKNLFKAFGLIAALVMSGAPAMETYADEGQYYLTIGGNRINFDSKRNNADSDAAYTFGFGYDISNSWSSELSISKFNLDTRVGDIDLVQSRLDFFHTYNNAIGNGRLSPFTVMGIGHNKFDGDDETFANIGGGLKLKLNDNLEWRTAVRAYHGFDDSATDFGIDTALVYRFGPSRAPRATVAPTPAPAAVTPVGDQDGDGVPDDRDACPDTPRTHRVDARGCSMMVEEVERIELAVQFDFDQDVVKQEYLADIRRVADFLRANTGTTANLEGHTDSVGDATYNQDLSVRRVNAVRQVLVSQFGIDAGRVTARGFGESQPVASNDTAEGRAQNRRVVSIIAATLQRPQTR